MPRLAVVSDSHLSAANPDADQNWEAVLGHLEATVPELVIHGGDITADGNNVADDLGYARAKLDRIPSPWLAVPGNHDLGGPETDPVLIHDRRDRYQEVFGDRFWTAELGSWRLVGLDSETLISGRVEDEPWWSWTAEQLRGDRPILVVLHRPVAPIADGEREVGRRFIGEPNRSRLRRLLDAGPVEVVISGHAHQWRNGRVDGIRWIWAPSTWAMVGRQAEPVLGHKAVGILELDLDAIDDAELVVPTGMVGHVFSGRPSVLG